MFISDSNALGTTLLTLIPFVILALYTFRAVEDNKATVITLQRVVWGIFTAFILFFYISGLIQGKIEALSGFGAIYILTTIVSACIFVWNPILIRQLANMQHQAMKEVAERRFKGAGEAIKNLYNLEKGEGR